MNGAEVSFTSMTFSGGSSLSKSGDRTAFAMYDLATVSLNAGSNTVRLQVNNTVKGEGDTQKSVALLVDYTMLYVPMDVTMGMNTYSN